jgi:hypothetical protein
MMGYAFVCLWRSALSRSGFCSAPSSLFPAFALTAIACSIVYSFNNFSGTIIGCVADLLGTVIALQLGYFLTVITIVLSRCILLARRNDQ